MKGIVRMNYGNEIRTIMKAAIYVLLLIDAIRNVNGLITHKFLFSKETVLLRLW